MIVKRSGSIAYRLALAGLLAPALWGCSGGRAGQLARAPAPVQHPARQVAATPPPASDCKVAGGGWMQAVCADPAMRTAMAAVSRSYDAALAAAPPSWREPLRASQRSWLAYMSTVCMPGDLDDVDPVQTAASCREAELAGRKESLDQTLVAVGGRRFVRLVTYHARPASEDDLAPGEPPHSRRTQAVLLQIANPATEAERGWNNVMAARLDALMHVEPDTAAQGAVTIEAIGPDFIQAVVRRSDLVGSGGADLKFEPVSWSLRLGRTLTASDLFKDPNAGAAAVARLAEAHLQRDSGEVDHDFLLTTSELRELLGPTRYWSFTGKGLTFDVDNDGEYGPVGDAGSAVKATIPWGELQPYLRSTLPFDRTRLKTLA